MSQTQTPEPSARQRLPIQIPTHIAGVHRHNWYIWIGGPVAAILLIIGAFTLNRVYFNPPSPTVPPYMAAWADRCLPNMDGCLADVIAYKDHRALVMTGVYSDRIAISDAVQNGFRNVEQIRMLSDCTDVDYCGALAIANGRTLPAATTTSTRVATTEIMPPADHR